MSTPKSGDKVIGSKPLWQLWAEQEDAKLKRGQELIDGGAFTAEDFAKHLGWSRSRARHHLERQGFPCELAADPRRYRNAVVRFYTIPSKIVPELSQAPASPRRMRRS
ncbi:MAG: hypothetical protein NDI75_15050 [Candidatus Didemnitutus sp.]|nr:hypothetical protein [Candidatus Didemnitutus sp.]